MSPPEAQLSSPHTTYFGFSLTPTHKHLILDLLAYLHSLSLPSTKPKLVSFLEMANVLCSRVPRYSLLVCPLHQATSRSLISLFLPSTNNSLNLKTLSF